MKILFTKKPVDSGSSIPFAIYQYDESLTHFSGYIDVKTIIKKKSLIWLDEIETSHAELSKRFLAFTRWFWVTPMSRLDARPWGQEYIFKPLFFARALSDWMESHPQVQEIIVTGADPFVSNFLQEFQPNATIEGGRAFAYIVFFVGLALKQSLKGFLKLCEQFLFVCRSHVFRKFDRDEALPRLYAENLVLYELVPGEPPLTGHRYYYGSIFDSMERQKRVSYACIPHKDFSRADLKPSSTFFLLDHLGGKEVFLSFLNNIFILLVVWLVSFKKIPCPVAGAVSYRFWPVYLFFELGRLSCFFNICSYGALKNVLAQGRPKLVIYPYEEKGIERAVLFACQEKNVKSIGYLPHPQHRLTLALRDTMTQSPKPSLYAVCGPVYVDYLKSWGRKNGHPVHVWGSGKSFTTAPSHRFSSPLKVFLFISHPNELRVFASWLKGEKRLTNNIVYVLRIYKGCFDEQFSRGLKSLLENFKCVQESSRDFSQDLSGCDIAAFCATSAGIVAVKSGRLAVHVCLDDFFAINPCFDDLENMLSCESATGFADRVEEIRSLDELSLRELYAKQQTFADKVFSPIQSDTIERDLACFRK